MSHTKKLVMAAMMAALVTVATWFTRIPMPFNIGYIHGGDGVIFLGVLVLGWKYGGFAGALGSAMTDLLAGYGFVWAVPTFIIKLGMAVLAGILMEKFSNREDNPQGGTLMVRCLSMLAGGVVMLVGYALATALIVGDLKVGLLSIPINGIQLLVAILIANLMWPPLEKVWGSLRT